MTIKELQKNIWEEMHLVRFKLQKTFDYDYFFTYHYELRI